MKIGILFNCQHHGLCLSLRALRPHDSIISFGFPALASSAEFRAKAMAQLATCDAVIAQPMSGRLRAELPRLRAAASRLLNLPAILFAGYHPDAIYITAGKAQLNGPTEGLHSRIAVCGFLGGLGVEETAMLYNRMVFARLGYAAQFPAHTALLAERFAKFGIELNALLGKWTASGCFMHSPNHPKAHVLLDLAHIACAGLGLEPEAAAEGAALPDTLAPLASHPVFPDLAGQLGANPESLFRPYAGGANPAPLELGPFLAASFAVYANAPRADLLAGDGVAGAIEALGL